MNWYKLSQEDKYWVSLTLPTKEYPDGTINFIKWIYFGRNLSNEEALEIIERAKIEQNSDDILTFEMEADWRHPEELESYARKTFRNPWISVEIMPNVSMEEFEKEL